MSLKTSYSSCRIDSLPIGSKFVISKWGAPSCNVFTSLVRLDIEGFIHVKSEKGTYKLFPEYTLVYPLKSV